MGKKRVTSYSAGKGADQKDVVTLEEGQLSRVAIPSTNPLANVPERKWLCWARVRASVGKCWHVMARVRASVGTCWHVLARVCASDGGAPPPP